MIDAWTIARFSLREAIRARFYVVVLLFSLLALAAGAVLGGVPWGDVDQVILSLGWGAISLMSILLAVFFSTQQISRDRERRTLYMLLARPISRFSYLLGRYFALVLLLAFSIAAMTLALAAAVYLFGVHEHGPSEYWIPALWIWGKAASLTGFAVALAVLLAQLPALFVTFAIYVIGSSTGTVLAFARQQDDAAMIAVSKVLYLLFPNYGIHDLIPRIIHGIGHPEVSLLLATVGYFVGYGLIALALSGFVFERKDLE